MIISNITPPQVWSASARSLTNIGSGALAPTSIVQTSLAGAATVDLRTSAGIVANSTVGVVTGVGATAAAVIQVNDGSNQITLVATAAAAQVAAAFTMFNTSSVGLRINNTDATHACFYQVASFSWTI